MYQEITALRVVKNALHIGLMEKLIAKIAQKKYLQDVFDDLTITEKAEALENDISEIDD